MPSTLNILYSLTAIRTNRLYPERHATTYAFGVRKKGGRLSCGPDSKTICAVSLGRHAQRRS